MSSLCLGRVLSLTPQQLARRRHVRRTDWVRSKLEQDRLRRFETISSLLNSDKLFDAGKDKKVSSILAVLMNEATSVPGYLAEDYMAALEERGLIETFDPDAYHAIQQDIRSSETEPLPATETEDQPEFRARDDLPALLPRVVLRMGPPSINDISLDPDDDDPVSLYALLPASDATSVTPLTSASTIAALYLDYQAGLSSLSVLPPETLASDDPIDLSIAISMSKTQHELAREEGELWERLAAVRRANSTATEKDVDEEANEAMDKEDENENIDDELDVDSDPDADLASLRESVATLTARSAAVARSYPRRSAPPTAQTYAETRDILSAMGVPCVIAQRCEAEALASALVLRGRADFVASEDTVCFMPAPPS